MLKRALLALCLFASLPLALAQDGIDGGAAWKKVYEVLSHPRCSNCHVGTDNRPRWSGPSYEKAYGIAEGDWAYHGMNINADTSRIGNMTLLCATCHQQENADVPHGPPGAHVWALAPVEMAWFGKSSAEVCAALKDPATNGGRSLAEVADHVNDDELVHWGWKPGPGREPAPYSRKEAVLALQAWAADGAPCPSAQAEEAE